MSRCQTMSIRLEARPRDSRCWLSSPPQRSPLPYHYPLPPLPDNVVFHIKQHSKHRYLPFHSCCQRKDFRFHVIISKKMLFKSCSCDMYYHLSILHLNQFLYVKEVNGIHVWIVNTLGFLDVSLSSEIQRNNNFSKISFPLKFKKWAANEVEYKFVSLF